jgi:hypothetical protein
MDVPQGARLFSIGEIFDRAFTLMLRNFLQLTVRFGILALPFDLLIDWLQRVDQAKFNAAVVAVVSAPRLLPNFFRLASNPGPPNFLESLWIDFAQILWMCLTAGVLATTTLGIVHGARPSASRALVEGLRRWPRTFGILLLELTVVGTAIVVGVGVWAVPARIWVEVRGPIATTNVAMILAGIALTDIVLLCFLQGWCSFAFGAVALDDSTIGQALRTSWKLATARGALLRSLAFGLAVLACSFFGTLFGYLLLGGVTSWTNQLGLGVFASELVGVQVEAYLFVACFIFYLDAKARYAAIQDAAQNRENSAAR